MHFIVSYRNPELKHVCNPWYVPDLKPTLKHYRNLWYIALDAIRTQIKPSTYSVVYFSSYLNTIQNQNILAACGTLQRVQSQPKIKNSSNLLLAISHHIPYFTLQILPYVIWWCSGGKPTTLWFPDIKNWHPTLSSFHVWPISLSDAWAVSFSYHITLWLFIIRRSDRSWGWGSGRRGDKQNWPDPRDCKSIVLGTSFSGFRSDPRLSICLLTLVVICRSV